jgi:DNA replication initiation complex subunit (GINS family)
MVEISVTFETLFEVLRLEKKRGELQELPKGFFEGVRSYLGQKATIAGKQGAGEHLPEAEIAHARRQLENAYKILDELIGVRERKILEFARLRLGPEAPIEPPFLDEEKEFYTRLEAELNGFRKTMLGKLRQPAQSPKAPALTPAPAQSPSAAGAKTPSPQPASNPLPQPSPPVHHPKPRLIFLERVPAFLGKELETYGPFVPGENAELPPEIARVLITQGKARPAQN